MNGNLHTQTRAIPTPPQMSTSPATLLASPDALNRLSSDIARACDPSTSDDGALDEYAEALANTTEVLLARLDECERATRRARDEGEGGRAELLEAFACVVANARRDYAFVDSIEDALRSIENALTSLERMIESCERSRDGEARDAAYDAISGSMKSLFAKVANVSETWAMATGERGGQPASPTSPGAPGEYYFGDEDEEKDHVSSSSAYGGVKEKFGDVLNDAKGASAAAISNVTAGANRFVGSLADGLSRVRFGALRTTSGGNTNPNGAKRDEDDDEDAGAKESGGE